MALLLFSGKMAVGSWLRYTLGSMADAEGYPLTVVGYDNLLNDPEVQLRAIVGRHPDWSVPPDGWQARLLHRHEFSTSSTSTTGVGLPSHDCS